MNQRAATRFAKGRKSPLLATAALATALATITPDPARAQAFNGNPTTQFGGVSYNRATPGVETITVTTPTAVIDWVPADTLPGAGAIDYLPAGNTATFDGNGSGNFTVLNRVLPGGSATGRTVGFNGAVVSGFVDSGGQFQPGGSVWFYSPGGILVGATGTFDVGNLLLTTNAVSVDGNGGFLGPNGSFVVTGAPDSRSAVTISAGATINAVTPGGYVAVIAPRLTQSGTVNVDGSAAYVAAEAAAISINAGLFDIDITNGSAVDAATPNDGNTLVHDGATNLAGAGAQHVYMAVMPKNDAVTMLVSGIGGYDPASTATVAGDTIVLSAGADIVGGAIAPSFDSNLSANIRIGTGVFGPALSARASDTLAATGTLDFGGAADLFGGKQASIDIGAGQNLQARGDLFLTSQGTTALGALTGGIARLSVNGGSATIGGEAAIDAGAYTIPFSALPNPPATPGSTPPGANATGGSATLQLINTTGTVSIGTDLHLNADGIGGNGGIGNAGGTGQGGTALLTLTGSTLTIGGGADLAARGAGGFGSPGGAGTGGTTTLQSDGGRLSATGNITLLAGGYGGAAQHGAVAGSGFGGLARVTLSDSDLQNGPVAGLITSSLALNADGRGSSDYCPFSCGTLDPEGSRGGNGTGGTVRFTQSAQQLVTDTLTLSANGFGGQGTFNLAGGSRDDASDGGDGIGGLAELQFTGGAMSASQFSVSVQLNADGYGGDGGFAQATVSPGNDSGAGGKGGDAIRGIATASIQAPLTVGGIGLSSSAYGGYGGSADSGHGGDGGNAGLNNPATASGLTIASGGTLTADYVSFSAYARANSAGQSGELTGFNAASGQAQGGTMILSNSGVLTLSSLSIDTSVQGGAGGFNNAIGLGPAGVATGGVSRFDLLAGNAVVDEIFLTSSAVAGSGSRTLPNGGVSGGTAQLALTGGSLAVASALEIEASGTGFQGESSTGGNASGGNATFLAQNGASFTFTGTDSPILVRAEGSATADSDGPAGNGFGGNASFGVDNATVATAADLIVSAEGFSGPSSVGAGNATGGTATIFARGGGSLTLGGETQILANGTGGDGPDGGTGTGGTAALAAQGGTLTLNGASTLVSANGIGGGADVLGTGGAGIGGTANADVVGAGALSISSALFRANGTGGLSPSAPTLSGSGSSGSVHLSSAGGPLSLVGDATLSAVGSSGLASGLGIDLVTGASPIQATGDLAITTSGAARATGTATGVQVGGDATINGRQLIDIDRLSATGNATLTSLSAITVDALTAGGQVFADTAGPITLGSPGTLRIGHAIATQGSVSITTGGTLDVTGDILGGNIALASGDITIDTAARLGDANTNSLTLANNGTGTTRIGGTGSATGWWLSNTEFGRLQAHDITLAGPGDIVLDQLDIIGSGGADQGARRKTLTGSTLRIESPDAIRVTGAIALTSAGADDALLLDAGELIHVVTPSGSIAITDANGGLGGTLGLTAPTIIVATSDAAADIDTLSSTAARNNRLGLNDFEPAPAGFVRAGALDFTIDDGLYIQNSGGSATPDDRAGFTAGTGGVTIHLSPDGENHIIINGRITGASTTLAGTGVIPALAIVNGQRQPSTAFDPVSTANGCLILSQSCTIRVEEPVASPPVRDVIEEVVDRTFGEDIASGLGAGPLLAIPLIELPDFDPLDFAPLIDEPVTGTGNEDLWIGGGA